MISTPVPTITDNHPPIMRTEVIVTRMRIEETDIPPMKIGTVTVHPLTTVIMILYPVMTHGTVRNTEKHVSYLTILPVPLPDLNVIES